MLPSLVAEDSLAADFYVSVMFCASSPSCLEWLELTRHYLQNTDNPLLLDHILAV